MNRARQDAKSHAERLLERNSTPKDVKGNCDLPCSSLPFVCLEAETRPIGSLL